MSGFLGWTPEHGLFPPREEGQESELLRFMQRLAGGAQETLFREQMESITGESPEKGPGWADIFTVADAVDDVGIGAQRQIRGIDEGYGQGGIVDTVWRLMGDFVRGDSQTYQSPYGPDQDESAQMQGVEEAGMAERMASGLLVPGGGGVDLVQGVGTGVRAASNAIDTLGLVAGKATNVDDLGAMATRIPPENHGFARFFTRLVNSGESGIGATRKKGINKQVNLYDDAVEHGDQVALAGQKTIRDEWLAERMSTLTPAQLDEWEGVIKNGIGIENANRVLDFGDGRRLDLAHWYDTAPLRDEFVDALGEREGEALYGALMALTAVTSPMTAVRDNVDIAVNLMHHLSRGESLDTISRMVADEFGTIAPGKALYNAGYSTATGTPIQTQSGSLNVLMRDGTIDGQKISSFFNNLMGDFRPLTIDSHNMRQTLSLSGVDLTDVAQRRELINRLGVSDTNAMRTFWDDVPTVTRGDGSLKPLAPDEVPRAFANALYESTTASTSLYSTFESFQNQVLQRMVKEGRVPDMTPAEFQARLWVGANQSSQVADVVPAAQAMVDAIRKYGQHHGHDSLATSIRSLWSDPGGSNVLLEAAYNASDMAATGISLDDFRNLLVRGAAKATPRREGEEGDDNDLLGLIGLGGM